MVFPRELIEKGTIVCPTTKQQLCYSPDGSLLTTRDGRITYPVIRDVPILTQDHEQFHKEGSTVVKKFANKLKYAERRPLLARAEKYTRRDYRTKKALKAFQAISADQDTSAVLLNIGGGPARIPQFLNLNMEILTNVDLVADAHRLPFADNTVDGINCEAVLEHLREPVEAVREMYRVLKPGGKVFAATPFLQNYHGYPHHYQNFTHVGHQYLFAKNDFAVLEAGTCVGPLYTLLTLNALFIHDFFPRLISRPLWYLFRYATAPLRPLDRKLGSHPNAYKLASTTYVLAVKTEQAGIRGS